MAQLEKASQSAAPAINNGDNAWMLASCALVLMMTAPGLILFYGGLVRSKNVLSTMMHSLILMAVVSTLWLVFGYSMAFADGNAFFGNPFKYFLLHGVGAGGAQSAGQLAAVSCGAVHVPSPHAVGAPPHRVVKSLQQSPACVHWLSHWQEPATLL